MVTPSENSWNEPVQARSREKVARILKAALELAEITGSLDLKMTEVAQRAGVAVGTLYQFFPTRTGLIAKLFADEMAAIDNRVTIAVETAKSTDALADQIETELRLQLDLVRQRPGLRLIWASAALDPAIEAADLRNTRQNADQLTEHMVDVLPETADRSAIHATALLICHLWGSVIRLCVQSPAQEEGAILRAYAHMIAGHCVRLGRAVP